MKSPTVMPIVTVTIAVPICVALFCAVIPPASDKPDCLTMRFYLSNMRQRLLTGTRNNTPVTMDVKAVPPILRE